MLWTWISCTALYSARYDYIFCINYKRYIEIDINKYSIRPNRYYIDEMFYFLLPDRILVVGFDKKIQEFPNHLKLVDYNKELNLFIST